MALKDKVLITCGMTKLLFSEQNLAGILQINPQLPLICLVFRELR
jgi:hypothetical protein